VGMQICHRTNGCHLYLENASKRLEAYIKAGKAIHSTMLQFCSHHGAHLIPPPRSRGRRGRGRGGSSSSDFQALGDSPCVFFPRGRCRHAVRGAPAPAPTWGKPQRFAARSPSPEACAQTGLLASTTTPRRSPKICKIRLFTPAAHIMLRSHNNIFLHSHLLNHLQFHPWLPR
jgi:hypothetical protein